MANRFFKTFFYAMAGLLCGSALFIMGLMYYYPLKVVIVPEDTTFILCQKGTKSVSTRPDNFTVACYLKDYHGYNSKS